MSLGLTSEVGKQAKTEKRFFSFQHASNFSKEIENKNFFKMSPLALILSKTAAPAGGHIVLSLDQGPCEHAIPNSQTIKIVHRPLDRECLATPWRNLSDFGRKPLGRISEGNLWVSFSERV